METGRTRVKINAKTPCMFPPVCYYTYMETKHTKGNKMKATPKIYTAFRFTMSEDGLFDCESLLVPAFTSNEAEVILRQWGEVYNAVYLQTDEHMVIADATNASPIRVHGAYTSFARQTREEHAQWADVHTNSYVAYGETVPASYRLLK